MMEKRKDRKGEREGKYRESVLSESLAPSNQGDRIKDLFQQRLAATAASAMQARCTPSLYPATTLTQQFVIYQKIPKDNPDTRFPIPMLRNDTSAQSIIDPPLRAWSTMLFNATFSLLLRALACLYAFITTFSRRSHIFNVSNIYCFKCLSTSCNLH